MPSQNRASTLLRYGAVLPFILYYRAAHARVVRSSHTCGPSLCYQLVLPLLCLISSAVSPLPPSILAAGSKARTLPKEEAREKKQRKKGRARQTTKLHGCATCMRRTPHCYIRTCAPLTAVTLLTLAGAVTCTFQHYCCHFSAPSLMDAGSLCADTRIPGVATGVEGYACSPPLSHERDFGLSMFAHLKHFLRNVPRT